MRISIAFDGSTRPSDALAIAQEADRVGLDGVWNAEHLGLHDAVVPAALQLSHTERIEVGLVGLNADSRNPGLLAMEVSSLCQIGPGRVALQVGSGSAELALSIGISRTVGTMHVVERFMASLRRLLAGERVHETSDAFALDGFALQSHGAVPLLQLMAMGPRMLRLAAEQADGVSLSAGLPLSALTRSIGTVEQHLVVAGRNRRRFRITAIVIVGYDPVDHAAALRRAARSLAFSPLEMLHELEPSLVLPDPDRISTLLAAGDAKAAGDLFEPETVEALAFVATRSTLASRLNAFEGLGIDELALMLNGSPKRNLHLVSDLGVARNELNPTSDNEGAVHVR